MSKKNARQHHCSDGRLHSLSAAGACPKHSGAVAFKQQMRTSAPGEGRLN